MAPGDERVEATWDRRRTPGRVLGAVWRRLDRLWLTRQLGAIAPGAGIQRPRWITGGKGLALGRNAQVWHHATIEILRLFPDRPTVRIGADSVLRPYAHVGAVSEITIGDRVGIGAGVFLTDHEHDLRDPENPFLTHQWLVASPIVIEDDAFIGERAVILRGTRIGRGAIIGANSVVKGDIPPYSIAAGIPARVVRRYDPEQAAWVKP
ncbi:MAG: DapH/DapD/GlmU-related protein [Planctomycetota bacterium]